MFRRVLITGITGFVLVTLSAVAQDTNGAPVQSTGSTAGSAGSQAATTPSASAQSTTSSNAGSTANSASKSKHSSKKAKKNAKYQNPIADVDSKQPDKVLFDRAEDAIKHGKYDIARLSLQTLINTYPDSEYVARAKLAIGDSWYDEGGAAAYAQAESEYKDFITFFPNMPEAAEAQMKIANIHFREMEKADRDPTHALRAEDEYRQMILQFPDSPLIPQAKQRLLEVQEVLAQREYDIGHFYYLRDAYPAAIARLKSVTDTYPLYSGSADALLELGDAYEKEVEVIRRAKFPEAAKGVLIKKYNDDAVAAYDRILTQYPLEKAAPDAKKRLVALKQPVPKATPQATAADRTEIASRGKLGTYGKVMENFHHAPDVSEAAKVGEPTLVDPKQASAPDMVRSASDSVKSVMQEASGGNHVGVEQINNATTPAANAPAPQSQPIPGTTGAADTASTSGAASDAAAPAGQAAGSDMQNDLAPSNATAAPLPPPNQVNDLANPSGSTAAAPAGTTASTNNTTQTASAQQAPPVNSDTESSSKKKKKKHLLVF